MALFDIDDEQRNLLIGIGVGIATLAVVKGIGPAFRGVGRPLAKAGIRSGILMADKTRELLAHAREDLEDLVAEIRTEMHDEVQAQEGVAGTSQPESTEGAA